MKITVTKERVWAATLEDRPGGLQEKLQPLAEAGADFEFLIARRRDERPGEGVVFVTPLKGAKQLKAAQATGFMAAAGLHGLRVEAVDQRGLMAKLAGALRDAGINLRGASGAAMGKKMVAHLSFDSDTDAAQAMRVLRKI
jgi:hypothetical protein